jgi:DNA-directed RNA polymerase specialized sigma24 family protein
MGEGNKQLDRSELDALYRRYGAMVLRRARRILADEQLAHDVCQDVFIQLLRAGRGWDAHSPVGWLFRTTTNHCLNLIRGTKRWHDFLRLLPAAQPATPSLPVQLLLRGVPERLHDVAIYYGLDRMSQDEIALALGLSQKTVSNRIRELRSWLDDAQPAQRSGKVKQS